MSKSPLMLNKRPEPGQPSRPKALNLNSLKRNVLTVEGIRDGFHACWVNEDQVDRYLDIGYDFVRNEVMVGSRRLGAVADAARPGDSTISRNVGGGVVAYLMEVPNELYEAIIKYNSNLASEQEEGAFGLARQSGLKETTPIQYQIKDTL